MANQTIRLTAVESIYVEQTNQNTNNRNSSVIKCAANRLQEGTSALAVLKFNIPEAVKKSSVSKMTMELYGKVVRYDHTTSGPYYVWPAICGLPDLYAPSILAKGIENCLWNDLLSRDSGETFYRPRFHIAWFSDAFESASYSLFRINQDQYSSHNKDELAWQIIKYGLAGINSSSGAEGSCEFSSVHSSNPPVLEIVYDKDNFGVRGTAPAFIDNKKDAVFTWTISKARSCVLAPAQTSYEFRWRDKGSTGYQTQKKTTSEMKAALSAGTLSEGTYEWQVAVTADNGGSSVSPWMEFTTVDSKSTVKLIRPRSTTLDGTTANLFEWEHIIGTGTQPTGFDLQYSVNNGGTWTNLASQKGTELSYPVPAHTLPAGNLLWRVRTYNTDNVAGDWSEAATVLVRAAPKAPTISGISNKPRPAVIWQAEGQVKAEIRFGEKIYSFYGAAKGFQCPEYLEDGPITTAVRVQNSLSLWSEWGEITTAIANIPGKEIRLTTNLYKNGVRLNWNSGHKKHYIYRNGELIGKTEKQTFTDYLSNGKNTYQVRGITEDDYYTMSNEAVEILRPKSGLLAEVTEQPSWIVLDRKRGGFPVHEVKKEEQVSLIHYSGRRLPVAHISGFTEITHTMEFTLKNKEDIDRISELTGRMVVYKDSRGDLAVGVLQTVTCTRDNAAEVTFEVVEVDRGKIEYDK